MAASDVRHGQPLKFSEIRRNYFSEDSHLRLQTFTETKILNIIVLYRFMMRTKKWEITLFTPEEQQSYFTNVFPKKSDFLETKISQDVLELRHVSEINKTKLQQIR